MNIYPYQQSFQALLKLTANTQSLQNRIGNAYIYNISFINIDHIPEHLRNDLRDINNILTKNSHIDGNDSISIAKRISDIDAVEIAQKIVSLILSICESHQDKAALPQKYE